MPFNLIYVFIACFILRFIHSAHFIRMHFHACVYGRAYKHGERVRCLYKLILCHSLCFNTKHSTNFIDIDFMVRKNSIWSFYWHDKSKSNKSLEFNYQIMECRAKGRWWEWGRSNGSVASKRGWILNTAKCLAAVYEAIKQKKPIHLHSNNSNFSIGAIAKEEVEGKN